LGVTGNVAPHQIFGLATPLPVTYQADVSVSAGTRLGWAMSRGGTFGEKKEQQMVFHE